MQLRWSTLFQKLAGAGIAIKLINYQSIDNEKLSVN